MSKQLTVLVTGSTDGIGKATALGLLKSGAFVIVHGRNKPRVDAAVSELSATAQKHDWAGQVQGVSFDLGNMASVRHGAELIGQKIERLDVLVNNAGIFATERVLTSDGMEATFAVNHAAPVLLTHLLMPKFLAASAPKVINVSSIAHTRGRIHLADLSLANNFSGYSAYAQSKLANVMHAKDLASDTRIFACSLHPGVITTKLLATGFGPVRGASVESGAKTSIAIAVGELSGPSGCYFSDGVLTPSSKSADDVAARDGLREQTYQLTKIVS